MRCRLLRPVGCVMRWASHRRTLLAPEGSRALSPDRRWIVALGHMHPGVVAGGLRAVLGSLVLVGESRGYIGLLVVVR